MNGYLFIYNFDNELCRAFPDGVPKLSGWKRPKRPSPSSSAAILQEMATLEFLREESEPLRNSAARGEKRRLKATNSKIVKSEKMPVMEKLRMFVAQEPVVAASCLIAGIGQYLYFCIAILIASVPDFDSNFICGDSRIGLLLKLFAIGMN